MSDSAVHRVLMTGDTVGGVWSFGLELAAGLGAHGVEVVLATLGGPPNEEQRAEAARISNLRWFAENFKLEWMNDPWQDVEDSGRWLLDLERHFEPDIIHLNSYGNGTLRWRAPVVLTAHSCVLSWWAAVKRTPLPSAWNRYRYEVEYALKSADLITAPSRTMLKSLEENYGADLPASRVVLNGRDLARYGRAPKEALVLSAGRLWDEAKNVAAVAAVAARLPWPVYLAGERRHPDSGCAHFAECRILGQLSPEALAEWYARAAIYVLPARYEPFGLSALEAALSGCALVLGDIDSLREIWDDTAVFVPPDDVGAIEVALRQLIAEPDRREEMAKRSWIRAQAFNSERMAREYMDAYCSVANTRRAACVS